jgi:shikimate 5-dehydrogenase
MNKLVELKEYLSELALFALFCRIVFLGAGIGDAIAVIALVLSMGYNKWLVKNKIDDRAELEQKIEAIANLAQKLQINQVYNTQKVNDEPKKSFSPGKRVF